MRVFVYWNLHKHLFSVREVKTGLVIHHANELVIENARFSVGQKGRERVLREKRKNVHAGVRGAWPDGWVESVTAPNLRGFQRITYNPYKHTTFVRARDEAPVEGADLVVCAIRNGRARIYAKGLKILELSA